MSGDRVGRHGEEVEREAVFMCWGGELLCVRASVASAGVPARCGGPWARLGAWAPSLVCGGFARSHGHVCLGLLGGKHGFCG